MSGKSRPILFSAPMVLAILNGSKKQTRRIVKNPYKCPHGCAGDTLWVRETIEARSPLDAKYCADGQRLVDFVGWYEFQAAPPLKVSKTPSIFMPKWASRITLYIKSVKQERLHDISEADALLEGVGNGDRAKERFTMLWRAINGDLSWCSNPLVWVIDFEPEVKGTEWPSS